MANKITKLEYRSFTTLLENGFCYWKFSTNQNRIMINEKTEIGFKTNEIDYFLTYTCLFNNEIKQSCNMFGFYLINCLEQFLTYIRLCYSKL